MRPNTTDSIADSLHDIVIKLVQLRNKSDEMQKELVEIRQSLHDISNFLTVKPLIHKAARVEGE